MQYNGLNELKRGMPTSSLIIASKNKLSIVLIQYNIWQYDSRPQRCNKKMCTIIKYANFHIIEKCSNLFSNNAYSNNDNIANHKWIAFPIFSHQAMPCFYASKRIHQIMQTYRNNLALFIPVIYVCWLYSRSRL